ncbi:MAG TPA: glycosyltransferase family 87 protein [Segetibacter sp.]|jgi:hypothetical protein
MKLARFAIFKNYKFLFIVFLLAAVFIGIQQTFLHESNNYRIFFYSLKHLYQNTNLYAAYPAEYYDFFLYSPSFPLIFSPFFLLPFKTGCFIWHLLFAAVWVLSVYKMPLHSDKKVFMYWFGFQELLTALGNSQTNPLIAAIPLFTFICFKKGKPFWAAFFIVLGFEIKIYSLVSGALFLAYPQKGKFILSGLFWLLIFTLLPLLIISPSDLLLQYQFWGDRLFEKTAGDKNVSLSVHRIISQAFSPNISPLVIVASGILLFCSVFIYTKVLNNEKFRMLLLASVLIFQVIFHPAAESASYITAVTGVMIWWLYCPKTTLDYILVIACFILTVMGPTDFVPRYIKEYFVLPYALKAWPCVLIWLRILYLMHVEQFANNKLAFVENEKIV